MATVALVTAGCGATSAEAGSTSTETSATGTTGGPAPTSGNLPLTNIPPQPMATAVHGNTCLVRDRQVPATGPEGALPSVSTATTGAVVFWLPGMNSKSCHAVATNIAADPAQDLARRINAAEPRLPGSIACPADDGTAAAIYFQMPGAPDTEGQLVVIKLSGCQTINDARRLYSIPPAALDADLGPVMPAPWRRYVAENGW